MSSHDSSQIPAAPQPGGARVRSLVLVGILVLLLVALWYDYKVARPAVEKAYDEIALLNDEINAQSGRKYMTNKDVQQKLQREPSEEFEENGYHVEIYYYRGGIPIRPHKYYAVYTSGTPAIFLKQYKFDLDKEKELASMPMKPLVPDNIANGEAPSAPMSATAPVGAGNRARRPAGEDEKDKEDAKPPADGATEEAKQEKAEDKEKADTKEKAEPAKSEDKPENGAAKEASPPASPTEKPAAENKDDKKSEEKKSEDKPPAKEEEAKPKDEKP